MAKMAPVVTHAPGTWRLIYYAAPNRGEQVRLLFRLTETPFVDVRIDKYPDGTDPYKKAALGDKSPLAPTDKCPAVTNPEGESMVETGDIMRVVGTRLGLPANDDERGRKATALAQDVINNVFYKSVFQFIKRRVLRKACGGCGCCLCLMPCIGATQSSARAAGENFQKLLPQIEEVILGPFVCGDQMAYCDVAIYCTLMQSFFSAPYLGGTKESLLKPFPKTAALYKAMEQKAAEKGYPLSRTKTVCMGFEDPIEYLARANTPFPCAGKVQVPTPQQALVMDRNAGYPPPAGLSERLAAPLVADRPADPAK